MAARRGGLVVVLAAALAACSNGAPRPECAPPAATPDGATVCAHLADLGCVVVDCEAAYADWAAALDPGAFGALAACYLEAGSCAAVDACNLACLPDGGPVLDDAGVPDDAAADAT